MANITQEVSYVISAKDVTSAAIESAKAGITSLQKTSSDTVSSMEKHWTAFKGQWLAVTAAVAAAAVTLRQAWKEASDAASYLEQMQLLDALAQKYGTTSTAIVQSIEAASGGMIGMGRAAEVAAAGLAKGLTPKMLTDLAGAAQVMADFMGVKVEDAFQQFAKALETGRTRSITAAVGINEMTNATEEMTEKMTPAVKAQAAYNAIMEATARVQAQLGEGTESVNDRMEKFEVQIKNLRLELGINLVRAGMMATAVFQYLAAGVLGLVAANERLWGQTENADAAWQARNALIKDAASNYKLATSSTEELTAASARNAAAQQRMAEAERQTVKATQDATKALQALSQVQAKVGEEHLKLAHSGYSEALKTEGATIAQMRTALATYLTTIQDVYAARIDGEKQIADLMAKNAGNPAEKMKIDAEVLKLEKATAAEKLSAWQEYYTTLQKQHQTATEAMKKNTADLAALEKDIRSQQQGHAATMLDLQVKLAQARGKAASDESIYQMKLKALENERAAAMQLQGQEQIAALEKVKSGYASLTGEVTKSSKEYDQTSKTWVEKNETIITSEKAIEAAIRNVASVQEEIASAQRRMVEEKQREGEAIQKTQASLAAAMTEAKAKMTEYEQQIIQVSNELTKLDKTIAITVNDQASGPIAQIAKQLAELRDKVVTVTIKQVAGDASAGGGAAAAVPSGGTSGGYDYVPGVGEIGGVSWDSFGGSSGGGFSPTVETTGWELAGGTEGSYAFGTPYVPRTGPYLLHEGEAVLTKRQAAASQNIHFAPNIVINGSQKTAAQLAKEIVRPLQAEMRRLNAIAS